MKKIFMLLSGFKKLALLFGNLALNIAGYLSINRYLAVQGHSYELASVLDRQIPFIKYFAPFYSIVYLLPVLTFFLCWNHDEILKAAAKAFAAAALFCFACFLVFPVRYDLRVELHPPYDFFTGILKFFYTIDEPYNCFPSIHVTLAWISAFVIQKARPRLAPLFRGLAVLICFSVLLMKQHYVADLAGGLAVSWLMRLLFLSGEFSAPQAEEAVETAL
ncbi:MAG TPA: hypothetical protein DF383_06475 [Deltaproteobacteria bacterium]|nr:hypothetical protein [Deltaproteobacteria bacterium]